MGAGETISKNGTYTMSNLSSATSVGSYKLSDHHPNLNDSETAFSDFVCKALGDLTKSGANQRRVPITLYQGNANKASGSYNSNDNWKFNNISGIRPGVQFTIFIPVYNSDGDLGDFFIEAVLLEGDQLTKDTTLTSNEITIVNVNEVLNGSGNVSGPGVEIRVELSSQVPRLFVGYVYNDPLNDDADNRGKTSNLNAPNDVGFAFITDEVKPAQVLITSWGMELYFDSGLGGWEVDHNPSSHFGGATLFDPSDDATNPTWKLYDGPPDTNSPFATSGDSEFLHGNHGGDLFKPVTKYPSGSTMDWWVAVEDDQGKTRDVVQCRLDDGAGTTDPWPRSDGNQEHYLFTTSKSRDEGTLNNPQSMNYDDATFS
jgi:hypothetical protein